MKTYNFNLLLKECLVLINYSVNYCCSMLNKTFKSAELSNILLIKKNLFYCEYSIFRKSYC